MINRIADDIKQAMRSKDKARLLVLRSLKTDLMNRKIEKRAELSDEEALEVVRKAAKSREQAAELYDKGERPQLAATERAEIEILRDYLPQALSEQELRELVQAAVTETGASGMQDMGAVMSLVMERSEGRADGKSASGITRIQATS